MAQHTMPVPPATAVRGAMSPLLGEQRRLLETPRPAIGQARCFDRLPTRVVALALAVERPTITGLRRTLGLHGTDGSAFYRLCSRPRPDDAMRC